MTTYTKARVPMAPKGSPLAYSRMEINAQAAKDNSSKIRYFIAGNLKSLDEVPEGSVVNGNSGPSIDYIAHSHEMNSDCDCEHCERHVGLLKGESR